MCPTISPKSSGVRFKVSSLVSTDEWTVLVKGSDLVSSLLSTDEWTVLFKGADLVSSLLSIAVSISLSSSTLDRGV